MAFDGAAALGHAVVAAQFGRAWAQADRGRSVARAWGAVYGLAALGWGLSALLVPAWARPAAWGLLIGGVVAARWTPLARTLASEHPSDDRYLSERHGEANLWVLGASGLGLLGSLWWIHFDDVTGAEQREGPWRWIQWVTLQGPLALALASTGAAVIRILPGPWTVPMPTAQAWWLCGSLAAVFVAVAGIDRVTARRKAHLDDRWRVRVRLATAAVIVLLGASSRAMPAWGLAVLLVGLAAAQVVVDLAMAPAALEPVPVGTRTTAEIARERTAGGRGRRGRDPTQVVRRGTPAALRRDLYFFLMDGSWTRLFGVLTGAYLVTNVVFAGLYLLEPGSLSSGGDTALDAFAFSVQTMSTIGYGSLSPAMPWADLVVTVEAAVGLLGVALATGLMFAKASRPVSKVLFSDPMVVTTWHGDPTLVFRVGNARGNEVVDATMGLFALIDEVSEEGHHVRRLHELTLERTRSPVFTMSWVVMHRITPDSPLVDVDWSHPEDDVIGFVATLMGFDATYAQTLHARHFYRPEDVRPGHRFVDIIHELPDGRMMLDYDRFHDTVDEAAPDGRACDLEGVGGHGRPGP